MTTTAPPSPPAPAAAAGPRRFRRPALGPVLLALVAYVPLLLTQPGKVGADTKTYLYLDPGRLLSRAMWMWDTNIGLGTVTHQNIGYLWPMGPWYWVMQAIGLPDWVAQRLWLGTIIFAAGMGVRFMLKELRWRGAGVTVAAFAYALSPYLLDYGARISVILLPFAGLPWLIGMASKALRQGGWRWPAAFALVTLTVGGVNATSLLLVMAGPLLWFVHAVFVAREVSLGRAIATGLRITVLTLATSLWWMAGLTLQGTYGIPILRYTETYFVVAHAAMATELLRGLGYWFFYGRDALGAWIAPAERMVQSVPALVLSFTVPGLALASGFLTRFRNRGFFALLVAVGLVLGVGAHPWDAPTPAGALFKAWTGTDSGMAFRSTPRAIPLIALGLAVMLAAGLAALSAARPAWHNVAAGGLLVLICANQWSLFNGQMVDRNLQRDEHLPRYWLDAAAAMQAGAGTGSSDTRVYEMPGSDFASYRWGNTVDPITPGLMDRPYAARELIPYGTPPSADLLNAWDVPLQQGSFDPSTIQPVAQLLGVGTIVHRADLQYERFRTPRPRNVWHMLNEAPGLGAPQSFGTGVANEPSKAQPLDDEVYYGTPAAWADAPAVSLFPVDDPRPTLRTVAASSPTLMAGDGAGIVNWAATGALDPDRPIFYSASFADDPEALDRQIAVPGAQLVVTDTNRKAARRWGSVRENDGYTERSGEVPLHNDPADNRLDTFPGTGDDAYTVSEQVGGATLEASAYGNPVSYTPSDRAVMAMDGNPATAWRVGAFDEPRDQFLEVRADKPVTADHITLLQSQQRGNRWMTRVDLSFDGGPPVPVDLGEESLDLPGQVVPFPSRTFRTLRITITDLNVGRLDRYIGRSDVGIAEVTIPGVDPVTEVVRPPTDLLAAAGAGAADHPLTYVFARRRADPSEVDTADEEAQLKRWVQGPTARSFAVFGKATVSTRLTDAATDHMLGVPAAQAGGLDVSSSAHIAGDLRSRGTSAVDGDPSTAWQTPINRSVGQWVEVTAAEPIALDHLDLQVVRDGRHSVPTRVSVQVDGGPAQLVDVPVGGTGDRSLARGAVTTVAVPLSPVAGRTVRVTIDAIDEARSKVWLGDERTVLPVGIAELGLGRTVAVPSASTPLATDCRSDLLTVAGAPVGVRVDGTVGDALDHTLVPFAGCGGPVALPEGRALLETQPGVVTGIDVDQVALASAPGGGPGPDTLQAGPAPVDPPPATVAANPSRLTWTTEVTGATQPYWVVLGQSLSPGFRATAADGTDLGPPTLVNGFANGWRVDPAKVGRDTTITITWAPQSIVWVALGLSLVGVLLCLVLLVWPLRLWAGRPLPAERPADMVPAGISPRRADGAAAAPRAAVPATVAIGLATWVLAGWPVALGVAALTALALMTRRGEVVLRFVGIGLFAAAAAFVVLKQWRNSYIVDFNWMNQFEATHAWSLAAVALLLVDTVVTALRARGTGEPTGPPGLPGPTDP